MKSLLMHLAKKHIFHFAGKFFYKTSRNFWGGVRKVEIYIKKAWKRHLANNLGQLENGPVAEGTWYRFHASHPNV